MHGAGKLSLPGVDFGVLVRYGLAQVLACLPALAVAVGALVAGEKIARLGPAKLVRGVGLFAALVLVFVSFSSSTVVWVVDEGDGGKLSARRYLLWGGAGTITTLDGRPIPLLVGAEDVEMVANATPGDLVVEAAQYGGVFASDRKPASLAPGQARGYGHTINDVGDPPPTARVSENAPVSVRYYIRRRR